MQYYVIEEYNIKNLEMRVQFALNKKWELHGQLIVQPLIDPDTQYNNGSVYVQALVKKCEDEG